MQTRRHHGPASSKHPGGNRDLTPNDLHMFIISQREKRGGRKEERKKGSLLYDKRKNSCYKRISLKAVGT